MSVSDSIIVNARAAALYEQVSDPTRMGTWSPENRGATVHDQRDGAYVGMVFDGRNKRGRARWTTRCTVSKADPGSLFEFHVHTIGLKTPRIKGRIATWQYRFEEMPEGTKVTETWTDGRRTWPDVVANTFDKLATGGKTFADFQRGNIRKTLSNLKKSVEAEGTA